MPSDNIVNTLRSMRRMLSTREVASYLGYECIDTVQRMAQAGKLPCVRMGKRLKFDPVSIADFIEARMVGA